MFSAMALSLSTTTGLTPSPLSLAAVIPPPPLFFILVEEEEDGGTGVGGLFLGVGACGRGLVWWVWLVVEEDGDNADDDNVTCCRRFRSSSSIAFILAEEGEGEEISWK